MDAVSPEWMVISAGRRSVGTNKSFMHPRLTAINNLMTFVGAHENSRYVDVYVSARKV